MTCRRLLLITDWRSQHCLRSLFLLFVAAESSGKEGGGGPGPAESVLIGTFTQECQWGEGSSIGGTEKSPAPSKRLATRATRLKTAGIQTYLLTWVPTGHARALPLGAVEADNSWYPNLSTAWVSTEHALGTTLRASGAASPGCDIFPTTSQPSSGKDTEGIISTHRI